MIVWPPLVHPPFVFSVLGGSGSRRRFAHSVDAAGDCGGRPLGDAQNEANWVTFTEELWLKQSQEVIAMERLWCVSFEDGWVTYICLWWLLPLNRGKKAARRSRRDSRMFSRGCKHARDIWWASTKIWVLIERRGRLTYWSGGFPSGAGTVATNWPCANIWHQRRLGSQWCSNMVWATHRGKENGTL